MLNLINGTNKIELKIYMLRKKNMKPDVNLNGAERHDVPGKCFRNKSFYIFYYRKKMKEEQKRKIVKGIINVKLYFVECY